MNDPELREEKQAVEQVDKAIEDPKVYDALVRSSEEAALTLGRLLYTENVNIRLAAARDILDRTGWKPIERKDVTSGGQPISNQPLLSDEQLRDIVDGFIKRTAINVEGKEVRTSEGNLPSGS